MGVAAASPLPRFISFMPAKATTARISTTAMMSMMLNFPMRIAFCSIVSSVKRHKAPCFSFMDNIRETLYNIFLDSTSTISEKGEWLL